MQLDDFYNLHVGETILLVGNGANLHLTPPAWFDYPSIGMNTIHKYNGWKPTYYTTVDNRVWREFGNESGQVFGEIPKFIPTPTLDCWQGQNFYRWHHKANSHIRADNSPEALQRGISYMNIMHVAMQLAYWMGAKTIPIIGMEHIPDDHQAHFWGTDEGISHAPNIENWFKFYAKLAVDMKQNGVDVLNISKNTFVPEDILPRADWRDYPN